MQPYQTHIFCAIASTHDRHFGYLRKGNIITPLLHLRFKSLPILSSFLINFDIFYRYIYIYIFSYLVFFIQLIKIIYKQFYFLPIISLISYMLVNRFKVCTYSHIYVLLLSFHGYSCFLFIILTFIYFIFGLLLLNNPLFWFMNIKSL